MKITRRQLKKLITESVSLLQEEEYEQPAVNRYGEARDDA